MNASKTTSNWQAKAEGLLRDGYKPSGTDPTFTLVERGWVAVYTYVHAETGVEVSVEIPAAAWTPQAQRLFGGLTNGRAPRGERSGVHGRVRNPGKTEKEAGKKHAAELAAAKAKAAARAPKPKQTAEQKKAQRETQKAQAKAEKAKANGNTNGKKNVKKNVKK